MSLIKNLIKEPEKPHKSKNGEVIEIDEEKEEKPRPIIKSAIDLQRLKLEKLMKNPDKPIVIPETRKEKDYMQTVPTFVRNVMGSSAGAGSGEFHVYRHLRRKEYARQKTIQAKSTREKLDEEYQLQLEENRLAAERKTAKKRAKRLKKKQHAKRPRQKQANNAVAENEEQSQASDESGNGQRDASDEEDKIEVKNCGEQTYSEEENTKKIESNLKQTSSENGMKGETSNQEDIAKQATLAIKDRVDIELESGAVSEKEETEIDEPNIEPTTEIQTSRESSVAVLK